MVHIQFQLVIKSTGKSTIGQDKRLSVADSLQRQRTLYEADSLTWQKNNIWSRQAYMRSVLTC